MIALAVVASLVFAVAAPAALGDPWLGERWRPDVVTDDVVAMNAELTVQNYHALEQAYRADGASDAARRRATQLVRREAAALDELIPKLERALKRPRKRGGKAPDRYPLSAAEFRDDPDGVWAAARAKTNLASALAYVYRARGSSSKAIAGELAAARESLPGLRREAGLPGPETAAGAPKAAAAPSASSAAAAASAVPVASSTASAAPSPARR